MCKEDVDEKIIDSPPGLEPGMRFLNFVLPAEYVHASGSNPVGSRRPRMMMLVVFEFRCVFFSLYCSLVYEYFAKW